MTSNTDISKLAVELYELVKNYVKQQTLVPLKRLGRYIGLGLVGSMFMSIGLLLLSLGFLRYLQTLSSLDNNLSSIPYLLVAVADLAIIGFLFGLMSKPSLIRPRSIRAKGNK